MDGKNLLVLVLSSLGTIGAILGFAAYAVLAERKIAARIQGRRGPNRTSMAMLGSLRVVGPVLTRLGIFQPMADGLKFLFKEDVVPGNVNRPYYRMALGLGKVRQGALAEAQADFVAQEVASSGHQGKPLGRRLRTLGSMRWGRWGSASVAMVSSMRACNWRARVLPAAAISGAKRWMTSRVPLKESCRAGGAPGR